MGLLLIVILTIIVVLTLELAFNNVHVDKLNCTFGRLRVVMHIVSHAAMQGTCVSVGQLARYVASYSNANKRLG